MTEQGGRKHQKDGQRGPTCGKIAACFGILAHSLKSAELIDGEREDSEAGNGKSSLNVLPQIPIVVSFWIKLFINFLMYKKSKQNAESKKGKKLKTGETSLQFQKNQKFLNNTARYNHLLLLCGLHTLAGT